MSHKVIVLANAVVDLCFGIESFPILPAQHQVTSNRLFTPGAMANTLICGARLGMDMIAMGNIGDGDLAELWRRGLAPENVDVRPMIVHTNEETSHALVLAEPSGKHVFLGARGMPDSGPVQLPPDWQESIAQRPGVAVEWMELHFNG